MAGADLTPLIVTYTYICFSMTSSRGRPPTFDGHGMLPYRARSQKLHTPAPSVSDLYPIIIHARTLDQ